MLGQEYDKYSYLIEHYFPGLIKPVLFSGDYTLLDVKDRLDFAKQTHGLEVSGNG